MKIRCYLRIGKTERKYKVDVSTKPNNAALTKYHVNGEVPIPTVLVALDLIIPDLEFDSARILLTANIEKSIPAAEIKQIKSMETV